MGLNIIIWAVCEMSDLSDFQKGQIIGACLPGASVTLSVLRTTVFMIMAAYTKHGKNSSANKNSGCRPKVNHRDSRTLRRIVSKQLQTTAAKVTAKPQYSPLIEKQCLTLDNIQQCMNLF
uniref:Uncharacterized protein n=1 Tax=Sinocyclocheilus rhinocerous TaxID=307959 RepID=A0A673KA24_9TELE